MSRNREPRAHGLAHSHNCLAATQSYRSVTSSGQPFLGAEAAAARFRNSRFADGAETGFRRGMQNVYTEVPQGSSVNC